MPPWCRGDSVLAERLEDMIELVRAMRDSENEVSLMQELFASFQLMSAAGCAGFFVADDSRKQCACGTRLRHTVAQCHKVSLR